MLVMMQRRDTTARSVLRAASHTETLIFTHEFIFHAREDKAMDGQTVAGFLILCGLMGIALKRISGWCGRVDSNGVVKKAAQDGVVRVISRLLK